MENCIEYKPVKCKLCEKEVCFNNTFIIENKINGNKLRICKDCGKEYGWYKEDLNLNIKDLKFDNVMEDFINDAEMVYDEVAKKENGNVSMMRWIEENIKEVEGTGILNNLTDREKFLFAFGALNGVITEGYMED